MRVLKEDYRKSATPYWLFTGKVNTELNFRTRFQLFDPDDPARYQLYADLSAEYSKRALGDSFHLALNIENNFDENRQVSDSVLPKVRSDVVRYLNEGEWFREVNYRRSRYLRSSLHYRGFAGVLEEMYSGAGGEILYWPAQSRLAFGAALLTRSSGTMTEAWGFWIMT